MEAIEKDLYAEAVRCIALDFARPLVTSAGSLPRRRDSKKGKAGQRLHHEFMSAFETACSVLWPLGVISPAPEATPQKAPHWFRLNVDVENVVVSIDEARAAVGPVLDDVLSAWLRLAEVFGLAQMTLGPFTPFPEHARLFGLLAINGYARVSDGQVVWTGKISPAMRQALLWPTDGSQPREGPVATVIDRWRKTNRSK